MQIKIRAWDAVNKRMLLWEDLLSGREFRPKMRDPEAYGLKLMLWTGTKDGNGEEIYEGDLLNHPAHEEPYVITLNYKYAVVAERLDCRDKDRESNARELFGKTKVIGNIYENSELMEEKE